MAKFDDQIVISHLQNKWGSQHPCTMCGKGPWNVHESTYQLTEYNEGNLVIGGPVIPVIPVICGNCGYTVLVNAILAGVVKHSTSPDKEVLK